MCGVAQESVSGKIEHRSEGLPREPQEMLMRLRLSLVNWVLWATVVLGGIAAGAGILMEFRRGRYSAILFYAAVYSGVLIPVLWRSLRYEIRALAVPLLLFLTALSELYFFTIVSDATLCFFACVVFTGILLGLRAGAAALGLSLAAVAAAAWLHISGLLPAKPLSPDLLLSRPELSEKPFTWLIGMLLLLFIGGTALISLTLLLRGLSKSVDSAQELVAGLQNEIAERRRAEGALRENEERYRTLVANIAGVVYRCACDKQWTMEYVNSEVETLTGYPASEFRQNRVRSFASIIHPEDVKMVEAVVFESVEQRRPFAIEYRIIDAKGELRWVFEKGQGVFDKDGELLSLDGVIVDINESKRAQALLEESERKFRAVFNNSFEFMGVLDTEGVLIEANQTALDFAGLKQSNVSGRLFWETAWWEHSEELREWLRNAVIQAASGKMVVGEVNNIGPDGELRYVDFSIKPVMDDEGKVVFLVPEGRDITDRKKAEEARREFEERWHSLANNTKDIIQILDTDGTILDMNRVLPPHEMKDVIGKSVFEFTEDDFKEATRRSIDRLLAGEGPQAFETAIRISESTHAQFEVKYVPMLADGEVDKIISFVTDIGERKRAEDELRHLRNYLSNIIDSMPSVLVGVDCAGKVTQWNSEAQRVTGLGSDAAVGRSLEQAFPRMAVEMARVREAMRTREVRSEPRQARREDGETRYEDVTVYPLTASGVAGAVIRVDDVTERVRIEEMMVQSEKMMSVGGLAAGMAHEINNPLGGMMQTASVVSERLSNLDLAANRRAAEAAGTSIEAIAAFMESRKIITLLGRIRESGSRAAEIVQNMLSFARKGDSTFSTHCIANLLDQCVDLAGADYDLKKKSDFRQIEIVREYAPGLPPVPCEAGKIQQVLLNILRNGAEAMQMEEKEGGRKARFILRLAHEREAGMLRIEIEDNGPGMDEATRRRVFEPFFTTKPTDRGTGLGLSVSYFIIAENHNGRMTVESQPGQRTKFIIHLPAGGKS